MCEHCQPKVNLFCGMGYKTQVLNQIVTFACVQVELPLETETEQTLHCFKAIVLHLIETCSL